MVEERKNAVGRPSVSVVRCFRGTGRNRERAKHRESRVGRPRARGGREPESDALFRAQYARRARPARCRVRVEVEVSLSPPPRESIPRRETGGIGGSVRSV